MPISPRSASLACVIVSLFALAPAFPAFGLAGQNFTTGPEPGDVYWEYMHIATNPSNGNQWYICVGYPWTENFTINIPRLENATKAEMAIEYWGGHVGTSNQRLVVNNNTSKPINYPLPKNTPTNPQCYLRNMNGNSSIEFPLDLLVVGDNQFQFFHDNQICHSFDWPQTWAYAAHLRIYFDPDKVEHPTGKIESPSSKATIGDSPVFMATAEATAGVKSVDFIGYYDDYDWEGNGLYRQWHYQTQKGVMKYHVGTDVTAPYQVTWNTDYLPDQDKPMKFMARIRDKNDMYCMTEAITCVRFKRTDKSIKMGKPYAVPEAFWVSRGRRMTCNIAIPTNIDEAEQARLILPTWGAFHGGETPGTVIYLNHYKVREGLGRYHYYKYEIFNIWEGYIKNGPADSTVFKITSATHHHPAEVMWPGPAVLAISPTPDTTYCDTCVAGCRIEVQVPDPVIVPAGTTFTDSISVAITSTSPACSVFYTVNGGLPTRVSTPYAGPFVLKESAVVNVRAYTCDKKDSSNVVSAAFTLSLPAPGISPVDTTFKDSAIITIAAETPACSIYYTTDGTDPDKSGTHYTGPFVMKKSATIKARAYTCSKRDSSAIANAACTYWEDIAPPQISPRGGSFPDSVRVSLSKGGRACSLYFTVDGSEPSRKSAKYEKPFFLKSDATVKARAYSCDHADSSLVSSMEFDISVGIIRNPLNPSRARLFSVRSLGNSLVVNLPHNGVHEFRLYAPNGQRVGSSRMEGPGHFRFRPYQLPPGIFIYRIASPSGKVWSGKAILMR